MVSCSVPRKFCTAVLIMYTILDYCTGFFHSCSRCPENVMLCGFLIVFQWKSFVEWLPQLNLSLISLQINRRMEFVFVSHSFDVWENRALEGSFLEECRLVNCKNPTVPWWWDC
ncbi:hypothetical protein MKX03_008327 [Papaver bracteatum]|nr:hypothetical protein MKX03_008327 [Papaver bracteatum]